jgi:hypothetical protein
MGINNSQNCVAGTEIKGTATAMGVLLGTLPVNPAILIFDNQGTASIAIYVNGTSAANLWRTFPSGEALILDLRAAQGVAPNFTFPIGTAFYAVGASGTFSISYVYAQNM